MTFAPPTLLELAALWTGSGGVNLGIVGDQSHTAKGTSYHLGRDQLVAGAYSATLARDRAGLSNAASAIDLGKRYGTLAGLQAFSVELVAAIRAEPAKFRDIREVIYSPDGKVVRRWDNELKALRVGGDGTGQGDDTHLFHTHISFYRDAEARDHTIAFAGVLDMQAPITDPTPKIVTVADNAAWYELDGKTVLTHSASALPARPSPYGVGSKRAIFANWPDAAHRRIVLVTPATTVPLPVVDCTQAVKDAEGAEHERVRKAAIAAAEAL
jgi:hypothetical protein